MTVYEIELTDEQVAFLRKAVDGQVRVPDSPSLTGIAHAVFAGDTDTFTPDWGQWVTAEGWDDRKQFAGSCHGFVSVFDGPDSQVGTYTPLHALRDASDDSEWDVENMLVVNL